MRSEGTEGIRERRRGSLSYSEEMICSVSAVGGASSAAAAAGPEVSVATAGASDVPAAVESCAAGVRLRWRPVGSALGAVTGVELRL